jgi:hypothetical protein
VPLGLAQEVVGAPLAMYGSNTNNFLKSLLVKHGSRRVLKISTFLGSIQKEGKSGRRSGLHRGGVAIFVGCVAPVK